MSDLGFAAMRGFAIEILAPYRTEEERRAFMRYLGVTPTIRYLAHVSPAEDLESFQRSLPPELTPGEIAQVSMSFLMDRQYQKRPPDPCPCY